MRLISSIPGLQSWPQATRSIGNFDSRISGSTKSSFLRFLIANEQYQYAWHLENDVFFSGSWKNVLILQGNRSDDNDSNLLPEKGTGPRGRDARGDVVVNNEADLLYPKANNQANTSWWTKGKGKCHIDHRPCKTIAPFQTYWMLVRFSRELATALFSDLNQNRVTGHHEAILASYCASRGFSFQAIPKKYIGSTFHAGNTTPFHMREAERRSNSMAQGGTPKSMKFYHPVKCVAYSSPSVMQAEIDQWEDTNAAH